MCESEMILLASLPRYTIDLYPVLTSVALLTSLEKIDISFEIFSSLTL